MNHSLLMKETVALEKASTDDFGQCCSIDLHGKMHVILPRSRQLWNRILTGYIMCGAGVASTSGT